MPMRLTSLLSLALSTLCVSYAEAQPNVPLMRSRASGLANVSVVVESRGYASAAAGLLSADALTAYLLVELRRQGATVVPSDGISDRTLVFTARVSCDASAVTCAVVLIFSRRAPRGAAGTPEVLIGIVGPVPLQNASWPRLAATIQGYSGEGAFLAAQLVR